MQPSSGWDRNVPRNRRFQLRGIVRSATDLLAVLILGTASFAAAQCFVKQSQRVCDPKDANLYCPASSDAPPTSQIVVANKTASNIRFLYDEWHSQCGTPGGKVHSQEFTVPANGGVLTFTMLSPLVHGISDVLPVVPDTGDCREGFIMNCTNESGAKMNCSEALQATMEFYVGNQQVRAAQPGNQTEKPEKPPPGPGGGRIQG